MERVSEKSSLKSNRSETLEATFDVMAIVSVIAVLAGEILAAAGAGWKIRAYFSIVAFLFDVMFSYEFFARLYIRKAPGNWLAGLTSIVPLLAVSGPFLSGWIAGDFGAAAVRGFWLAQPPVGGLATLAAFRLFRMARPFLARAGHENYQSDQDGSSISTQRISRCSLAAIIGMTVALAGAIASDAMIIPGLSAQAAIRRESVFQAIEKAGSDADLAGMAKVSGILALKIHGQVILAAPSPLSPSEYAVISSSTVEAWFSTDEEMRSRGWAGTICALASLAAAIAYALASSSRTRNLDGGYRDYSVWTVLRGGSRSTRPSSSVQTDFSERPLAAPTGNEELAGILGKRTH